MYVCIYIYIYIHTCMYTHIHTHTYIGLVNGIDALRYLQRAQQIGKVALNETT